MLNIKKTFTNSKIIIKSQKKKEKTYAYFMFAEIKNKHDYGQNVSIKHRLFQKESPSLLK